MLVFAKRNTPTRWGVTNDVWAASGHDCYRFNELISALVHIGPNFSLGDRQAASGHSSHLNPDVVGVHSGSFRCFLGFLQSDPVGPT